MPNATAQRTSSVLDRCVLTTLVPALFMTLIHEHITF